jgi:hypothetical protein
MQFLLIISHDDLFTPSKDLITAIHAWNQEMDAKGIRLHGNPLRPPSDATTVRVRAGKVALSDGPFTRSKDQICAYALIECASHQAAIDVAIGHPMASVAAIEVRPIWRELAA